MYTQVILIDISIKRIHAFIQIFACACAPTECHPLALCFFVMCLKKRSFNRGLNEGRCLSHFLGQSPGESDVYAFALGLKTDGNWQRRGSFHRQREDHRGIPSDKAFVVGEVSVGIP